MFKKVAVALVAGSLMLGAQAASADDTQFDIGGGHYLGVAALPFHMTGSSWNRTAEAPASDRLERTHASVMVAEPAPAPYNVPGGYFN